MTKRRVGRPRKYGYLIDKLNPNQIYSAASIARLAGENGFISASLEDSEKTTMHRRIRIALSIFSRTHNFSRNGDGMVKIPGKASVSGWYGWRWQREFNNLEPEAEQVVKMPKKELEIAMEVAV